MRAVTVWNVPALAGLLLLVSCASADGGAAAPTDIPTQPAGTEISGVLGGDAQLEGGCAWVETDDGTRYEVIYPEGYTVETDPLRLVGPDGGVVAEDGDRLELPGEVAEDMASICQIGPLWRADSVALDASQDAG